MKIDPLKQERIVAYALGELAAADAAAVDPELAAAPDLAETVSALRSLVETMRTDDTEAPTARAVRQAIGAAMRDDRRGLAAWLDDASRVVARLVFDSRAAPALAGFRGPGEGCQLAYECNVVRVDLRLAPPVRAAGTWRVRGRVTARQPGVSAAGPVIMRSSGGEAMSVEAVADGSGRFSLEARGGTYEMAIGVGGQAVTLVLDLS